MVWSIKAIKCRPTLEQHNPLCLIGEGWLSLLGRQTQAGCTLREDSSGNTPIIQGAYLTFVVAELKLMLSIVKYSSFSACH